MASFLTTRILRPAAYAMIGLAYAALLTGCDQRELCYDHNHSANVRVEFDWFFARNADVEGMTVLFYNEDDPSAEPIRYDLPGRDGGMVKLQPGRWRPVAYNNDTEAILYRGQSSPSTLEAYTRESSVEEGTQIYTRGSAMPRAANAEDETVILEPDMLYGATGELLILGPDDTNSTLTLQPEMRVTEIDITIHDVPNLEYAGQFGGALSGLAPSVMMASGALGAGCVTEAFTCHIIDDTTLQMKFRIFGHCPEGGLLNTHMLTIYAILADGTKWYYTKDITTELHKASEEQRNHIVDVDLNDLPLPMPIVNGSGLQPSVDTWNNIEIEVEMNN